MSQEAPFERLGRELEAAADRQIAAQAATPKRGWRRRTVAVMVITAGVGAGATAWAATSLLSSGAPVPFQRGAPIAGRAQGAPISGTVKLLADSVADPDGGPPWGLRYWETDRKYACVQVGRVYAGKLGQIGAGKVFHELRLGVTLDALGGCFAMDGDGHGFAAIHTDAMRGAQPAMPLRLSSGDKASRPTRHGRPVHHTGPHRRLRAARTERSHLHLPRRRPRPHGDSARRSRRLPGGAVADQAVIREYGFHHRDPKLNSRGPAEPYIALTPASQVIKRVTYTDGACQVRVTSAPYGACNANAGYIPIPQPKASDVRAPVRAFAAPDGRGIRVRFRARQAVIDGRSGYDIEVRPVGTHGFMTQTYSRNVDVGGLVRTTVNLYNERRGAYRIVVRYRTVSPRPGPYATLAFPGLLVGQTHVDVP